VRRIATRCMISQKSPAGVKRSETPVRWTERFNIVFTIAVTISLEAIDILACGLGSGQANVLFSIE
jgi:hypothetical protein